MMDEIEITHKAVIVLVALGAGVVGAAIMYCLHRCASHVPGTDGVTRRGRASLNSCSEAGSSVWGLGGGKRMRRIWSKENMKSMVASGYQVPESHGGQNADSLRGYLTPPPFDLPACDMFSQAQRVTLLTPPTTPPAPQRRGLPARPSLPLTIPLIPSLYTLHFGVQLQRAGWPCPCRRR